MAVLFRKSEIFKGTMILKLAATVCAVLNSGTASSETILNKADADHIFSLNRPAWDTYAERMVHPDGWKVSLSHHDTGITVMAYDSKTGMGMSIQPLYLDNTAVPYMLIVGSYYPRGSMPPFTSQFKARIEAAAQKDLGINYSVSAFKADIFGWEGIELRVTRKITP